MFSYATTPGPYSEVTPELPDCSESADTGIVSGRRDVRAREYKCLRVCGLHLNRRELAECVGVKSETVKWWEIGRSRPHPSNHLQAVAKLARKVGWKPSECTGLCA